MNNELKGQGEYRGDFTRDTHNPLKRFSRVLMQQGRVLLDADWNEQTSILLHYLRSLAADLIGEHGGPNGGFAIGVDAKSFGLSQEEWDVLKLGSSDFIVGKGHYYVAGVLCENDRYLAYSAQRDNPDAKLGKVDEATEFLVYLDVWERHVTYLQDGDADNPNIREVALGGPDTATRARVVWQVKVKRSGIEAKAAKDDYERFLTDLGKLTRPGTGHMQARARKLKTGGVDDCACVTSPESRYRGVENQLYRVEIHKPGGAWDGILIEGTGGPGGNVQQAATFKWSRENASVVFPIRRPVVSGDGVTTVTLDHLGRDARHSLVEGDWVEIVDDDYILQNDPGMLLRVTAINRDQSSVTLEGVPTGKVGQDTRKHPLLRRWDHRGGNPKTGGLAIYSDGAALLQEGSGDNGWLNLENGIQIRFPIQRPPAAYAPGDFWLIPARVATGDVEWPGPLDKPASLPPHGVQHYYAPLGIISVDQSGKVTVTADCRRIIKPVLP